MNPQGNEWKLLYLPQAMKIPDAKNCSGQGMQKAPDNMATGNSYSRSTKRQNESPLYYTDGHMSPQEMRSWNQNYRSA